MGAAVGIPLVPRLGDPCEDPGVIEWLGLGPAYEVVVSCRREAVGGWWKKYLEWSGLRGVILVDVCHLSYY